MRLRVWAALAVVAIGTGVGATTTPEQGGATPASPAEQVADLSAPGAPVVIDGEPILNVRGISVYPAERRAADLAAAIRKLAADASVNEASLTLDHQANVTWILANGRHLLGVLDEDAALENIDRRILADLYRARIAQAITRYRDARRPAVLWANTVRAIGATLGLIAVAWIGWRLVRALRSRLERRYHPRLQDVRISSFRLFGADQLWFWLAGLMNVVWALVVVTLTFGYLEYTLGLFPWTRGTASGLLALSIQPIQTVGQDLLDAIPDLVFLFVLFLVMRYVLRLTRLFFASVADGSVTLGHFDADWAWPTYRLVRLAIFALAVVIAYPYVPGSHTEAFKGVTIFVGILFSLGSSSFIGNTIAGYSLTFRRAFHVGDVVRIAEHVGEVTEIRLMVTHLRTPHNEEVVVPNSQIVATEVVNLSRWARERGLILQATVGIGYDTPWRQVEAMLLEAARRTPGLLTAPAPFVLQTALGDCAVKYELNAYCDAPKRLRLLYADLYRQILDVFNEYGVQIMTPSYEDDPEKPKVVPKDQWHAAPAQE